MAERDANDLSTRNARFALICSILPLSVFVIHSLANQTKLNWTGPVWLAILPWVAHAMTSRPSHRVARFLMPLRRSWAISILVLTLFIPVGLSWILLGAPGTSVETWYKLPIAWEEFGREIEIIEHSVEAQTGQEPLIVGIDKYWIASEASFYDGPDVESENLDEFAGRGIVGRNDLMWSRWVSSDGIANRTMILVALNAKDIEQPSVMRNFGYLGPVIAKTVSRNSRQIGRFYWRLASSYVKN